MAEEGEMKGVDITFSSPYSRVVYSFKTIFNIRFRNNYSAQRRRLFPVADNEETTKLHDYE